MSTSLVPYEESPLGDTIKLGEIMARSGFFADSRDAAQAVVKVLAGRELGFGPVTSMTGVYIVKGRITLSANLIAAAIKRSGRYNYRVARLDNQACEIEFYEQGQPVGRSTFTAQDATAAGLGGDNWRKFPRNMLFARALSNGAKWYCPDVFGGPVYTPDEMQSGEIIDAPMPEQAPTTSAQPAPAPDEARELEAALPGAVASTASAPTPPAMPANGKARPADVHLPGKGWNVAAEALAARCPYWANAKGQPNYYHIVNAAGKIGFAEITEANIADVMVALEKYAAENADKQP